MSLELTILMSSDFRVKDLGAFKKFCDMWDVDFTVSDHEVNEVYLESVISCFGLPDFYYDPETDDCVDGDFLAALAEQLADGEVAVVHAIMMTKWDGDSIIVTIDSDGNKQFLTCNTLRDLVRNSCSLSKS